MRLPIARIISGGQTGVDQVALRVAKELDYATGGWVPKGWRTDAGPAPWLAAYGCWEHPSPQWQPRTVRNARWADITVWFGQSSPGRSCTYAAIQDKRWWVENPTAGFLRAEILTHPLVLQRGLVINIAGNRLRTHPEASREAEAVLTALLR